MSRRDIESLNIALREVIDAVEKGFRLKGEGRVELPPKLGVHPRKTRLFMQCRFILVVK